MSIYVVITKSPVKKKKRNLQGFFHYLSITFALQF